MSKVTPIRDAFKGIITDVTGGGEPPHNEGMEARVKSLEEAIKNLPTKTDFAELRADMAEGREAVHKLLVENSRWTHTALVSMLSVCVLGILGLLFTIWNATKNTAPQTSSAAVHQPYQQPPIIINVPSTAPASIQPQATPANPFADLIEEAQRKKAQGQ